MFSTSCKLVPATLYCGISPRNLGTSNQLSGPVSFSSRPASLSCLPGSKRKGVQNCKLIKKAETKNHHQIILGNHEFSGKRLEEKSEKGKRYHRKCEREFQKLRRSIPTTKVKGERARQRENVTPPRDSPLGPHFKHKRLAGEPNFHFPTLPSVIQLRTNRASARRIIVGTIDPESVEMSSVPCTIDWGLC